MREQVVSFQVAKLAKEKGFNFSEIEIRDSNTLKVCDNVDKRLNYFGTMEESSLIQQPTQSLLLRWLREEHNIHIKIDDFIDDETGIEWDYEIVIIGTDLDERGNYIPLISYDMNNSTERKFKTYEEALEAGLQEALNLIWKKNLYLTNKH